MKSKAEIIRTHLRDMTVLDIGGTGYENANAYERELAEAWKLCRKRVTVDHSSHADISINLNELPLPKTEERYDVVTAFDVLEHLEHPADILRWIPGDRLIVILPNAMSWIARRMEEQNKSKHLYSFTPYTASILLGEAGWGVSKIEYQFGKWSWPARIINAIGSLAPAYVATGLVLHCDRTTASADWNLR